MSAVLVWVTGVSGSGKSTVCEVLKARGRIAVDADWEGLNHWVRRDTGERILNAPFPVPAGWMDEHAWHIDRGCVDALAATAGDHVAFLFGTVENDGEVLDVCDQVVCLVIDDETLRRRLATRTTDGFGKEPGDLDIALAWNRHVEDRYRCLGASIIDATGPIEAVVDDLLRWVERGGLAARNTATPAGKDMKNES